MTGPCASFDLGANTMSNQQVNGNPFYLDGVTDTGQPGGAILPQLTVGTPLTVNFFTASPRGTCDTSLGYTCAGNTATGTITASFTFLGPGSGATGKFTDTATYSADYNTSQSPRMLGIEQRSDCIVWSATNDPVTVNFTDGAVMKVTLSNAQDWAITPTITFNAAKRTIKPTKPGARAGVDSYLWDRHLEPGHTTASSCGV